MEVDWSIDTKCRPFSVIPTSKVLLLSVKFYPFFLYICIKPSMHLLHGECSVSYWLIVIYAVSNQDWFCPYSPNPSCTAKKLNFLMTVWLRLSLMPLFMLSDYRTASRMCNGLLIENQSRFMVFSGQGLPVFWTTVNKWINGSNSRYLWKACGFLSLHLIYYVFLQGSAGRNCAFSHIFILYN